MDKKAKKSLLEITGIQIEEHLQYFLFVKTNLYKICILAKATKEEITY